MNFFKKHICRSIIGAAIFAAPMIGLSSCDSVIYDDLDPCIRGLELRFVYDYNMLYANAFPSQVDCLTLLVYDSAENFVGSFTETAPALADENYRMKIDLPAGDYHLLAYGGLQCDASSFHFIDIPAAGSKLSQVGVVMDAAAVGADPGKDLHPLFYGKLDVTVPDDDSNLYTVATVPMMKDTHNVRVLLQHISGEPVDCRDFNFAITGADNSRFNASNDIVPLDNPFTLFPWTVGNVKAGETEAAGAPQLAFAEFSTSRLAPANGMRLVISTKNEKATVLSIPLVDYLLLLKSDHFASMSAQEYLDREDYWSVIFFLDDNNNWIRTHIVVNNWIVRINNINE